MTFEILRSQGSYYFIYDVFLAVIAVGVWALWRWQVLSKLGTPPPEGMRLSFLHKFGWGVLVALAGLALALLPGYLMGGFEPGPGYLPFRYAEGSSYGEAGLIWGFFAVQSLFEELAFRALGMGLLGTLLFWLANLLGPNNGNGHADVSERLAYQRKAWFICGLAANCAVSLAFAWIHRNNPHVDGIALANIVLAGLVLGQLFWQQGQPLGAWGFHWVWNAGQASMGLPVSGIAIGPALFDAIGFSGAKSGTLTGGAFGLEGSWPCGAALALILTCMIVQQHSELLHKTRRS